jgi:heavy metal sensor kinase
MSIRWRLTLWFTLILCAIMVLSGTVFYALLQGHLVNEVDSNLRVYSARVHGTLHSDQIPQPLDFSVIHSSLPIIDEFASPGMYLQIVDGNGDVVTKSDNLGEQELPVDQSLLNRGLEGNVAIGTVASGSGSVRIMASPLYLNDQILLLEVAESTKYLDTTMSEVRWSLLAAVSVALVLAGVSGWVIVRRALSPVERVTRAARDIETGSDLGRRVAYSGPADEVGRLAATFDHMIEHLERVFQSQKHFVADASHDLRGPLTAIQGNLDLLKFDDLNPEERQESLKAVEAETWRMASIVSDLAVLAELESGHLEQQEDVSLRGMLLDTREWAGLLAGNRRIVIERQDDLWVKGSAHRLERLLRNLVGNAIKYTPDGGTITLSLFQDGDWACLQVSDTGIGIAPEHLPHIFDRFYRVDEARTRGDGGSGLGLAIVKGIAEQHGGRVTAASEPGKGSKFTVWLRL